MGGVGHSRVEIGTLETSFTKGGGGIGAGSEVL